MFPYWLAFVLMSVLIPGMVEASSKHIVRRKDVPKGLYSNKMESSTWKERFFLRKRNMFDRVADETQKQGSFKIDDGKVIGGGTYEINKDGINLDMKIKINPDFQQPCVPTLSQHPTAVPSGQESTAPPSGTTVGPIATPTAAPGGTEVTPGTGGEGGSDFEQEALSLHNQFRKIHDSPPMKLNAEMSKSAATYAAELSKMGMNNMHHSSREERNGEGENLSAGCSTNQGQTVKEAITDWYNEVCGYTFGSQGGAGHFTQLVWKASVELGIGKADSNEDGMKCTYYVARYKPAGNMIGEYATNVLKGSFDPSYCNNVKQQGLFKRIRG